ncbi:MAG: DUF1549 domain-containing protein, partial [Verrucomicrobiaceae bacterium]
MIFFSNNFRPQLVMITMLTCSLVSMQAASGKEDANTPHWAFQPLRESKAASVDEFTEPALAAQHLTLGPQAGKRELIRRVTYDLTGLPPAVGEITSFLQDEAPGAMNRVIERLLASPHYGERWARWWLDVARYADSNGRDENIFFGNAWRYRDWTIRAFNENLPFDSFITDQLAGDLMSPGGASISQRWDRLTATGFLAMGCKNLAEQDKTKMVMDMVDEQIDMVSRAFLGLTVSCARCHDHKFDPISTRDYYALAGIFHSTKTMANLEFVSKTNERPMATAAEIAARKAHDQQSAVHSGSVNKAVEVANAALLASWMKKLPEILSAAGSAHEPVTKLPPTALSRLRDLMSEDSPTHPECQTLHRLASQAETIPDFLKQAALLPTLPRLPVSSGITGCSPRVDPVSLHNFLRSTEPSTSQFTVETWVRLNELPASAESRIWLVHQGEHPWEKGHYGLMLEGDHVAASMNLAGGPTQRIFLKCKTDRLDAAHWHHVAMTYDGTALRLFFNGDQVGKSEVTVPRVPKPSELGLGRSLDEVRQFNGNVVETRVYAEALPLPTIKKHHDARSGAPMAPDDTPGWNISELQQPDAAASANAMTYRALFGPRGILTLPSNPRPFYPAETSASIAALEKVRDD